MKSEVQIEMITTQVVDGQKDVSQVTYQGVCQVTEEAAAISYTAEEQGAKIATQVVFGEKECRMQMTGAMERTMEFVPGKMTKTSLQLPMAVLELGVKTKEYVLEVDKEEKKQMQVKLLYDLYSDDMLMAENRLDIRIWVK